MIGKILSFLVAIGKRKQAEESEQLSTQRIEYVRQLVDEAIKEHRL